MLDKEYDPELDDKWLATDDQLTRFRKARKQIVRRVKGTEQPSVQGNQYSEKYLVVRERFPRRTEMQSVIEPDTNGNHVPIGQSHNLGSSDADMGFSKMH